MTLLDVNQNKIVNTSFNEVITDIMQEREITSIVLSEIGGENLDMLVDDKEEIDKILGLYSKMKLRKIEGPKFRDKVVVQLDIRTESEVDVIFSLRVTDNGYVDVYEYVKNEGHAYQITNDFDFESLYQLLQQQGEFLAKIETP